MASSVVVTLTKSFPDVFSDGMAATSLVGYFFKCLKGCYAIFEYLVWP